mmetsp:Transcript_30252/g.77113  ORF Transcript_30252/g.77113 Transcript_30252/m.77113 type:complete len:273 (-) Transcript_30252:824-1642(-)
MNVGYWNHHDLRAPQIWFIPSLQNHVKMLAHGRVAVPKRAVQSFSRGPMVVRAAAQPKLKLYYFEMPARAECTRLMLQMTNYPHFEDVRFSREQWPEIKAKMPFSQVPVLEVDGKYLAQQGAIERYVAKLTGMYPADPWQAAKVDELAFFAMEFLEVFYASFAIKDADELVKARQAIVQGPLGDKLAKLDQMVAAAGAGFLCGPKPTYGDVLMFVMLSNINSGFFDGVPKDVYKPYPNVCAFHQRLASLPEVKAVYANAEGARLAFKPEATK